jgi:ATP-dependent helicase/nuclease subunit A
MKALIAQALDPRRSVVVESCAGSGKTWLLVSRIVRLLLDGAAPGEILAITYTRKAAREIEERLAQWLQLLAIGSDAQVREFLREREVPAGQIEAAAERARGLFEQVQAAVPSLTISTFHGWFARLVQGAPLSSDLAGFALHESGAQLKEEVWQLHAEACGKAQDAAAASLLWLLENIGADSARDMLFHLADRRAEWHAWAGAGGQGLERALERLRGELGVEEEPVALQRFFADDLVAEALRQYADILRASELRTDASCVERIEAARTESGEEARFALVRGVFVKEDGGLRERKPGKAPDKRFGAVAAARLLDLHARLGAAVLAADAAWREEQAYLFNRHALTAGASFLDALERHKRERRLMDFADLEWHVSRLLADEAQAAFLQARLDARYKHILLDEFQDTNPLQWQILLAWLGAYGAADADKPRVFVVGDPKQSIYRFRRAEPRVFARAAAFLGAHYAAAKIDNDATRRNAAPIVEVVNALFGREERFRPFRPHTAMNGALPGRVELLPLCEGAEKEVAATLRLRDPLTEPQQAAEDTRRRAEAAQLAGRLAEIVGRCSVTDKDSGEERPARCGDIMILTRRRSVLPEFERALRAAGLPYLSVGRGGLLRTLEASDLMALLRALVVPGDDLALAHALRTPLFGASDEDLLQLSARNEPGWWQRLRACAEAGAASPALAEAARLLAGWQLAAARLPVHDLLDRIYHEGNLVARYRQAVPEAMWPGVAANLEAFIALALQLDAGRYPSLPRFLDEMARRGQASDEDAPDEGVIHADGADDRIRILTIHGAKGLEAPIVWLIDAHSTSQHADAWSVLLDWPPDEAAPRHLSLAGRKDERGMARAALFEAEAGFAAREELNLLYVALTRARQAFFASGVASARNSAKTSAYARIAAAVEGLGGQGGIWGEALPQARAAAGQAVVPVAPAATPAAVPVGERRQAASSGMAWGTRLHAALDWLSAHAAPQPAARPPGISAADWPALRQAAQAMMDAPKLREFFDPARYRRALNEVEFALPDGGAGRIDRLVEREDGLWVLDYKSGAADEGLLAGYRTQLEAYRQAVSALFPDRPVRCALVFTDGGLVEI